MFTGEATLSFKTGPDFENPRDSDGNNVYEVTIVVTDGTMYDKDDETKGIKKGDLRKDELPVTVKVINSTEDNRPGSVEFSNRQPEIATEFTAELRDPDTNEDNPPTEVKWQWYRETAAAANARTTTYCSNTTPITGSADSADGVNERRHYVEIDYPDPPPANPSGWTPTGWEKIPGATSDTYRPSDNMETPDDDTETTTDVGRCLRATVTYRDGGVRPDQVDRTHTAADVRETTVDETLEATFQGTEQPVKAIDERNKHPQFTDNGAIGGAPESVYRAVRREDTTADTTPSIIITEAWAAADTFEGRDSTPGTDDDEDDTTNDLLTYELSGEDVGAFRITGTVGYNNVVTSTLQGEDGMHGGNDDVPDGQLTLTASLNYDDPDPLDDEPPKREYRVTITAIDPSGDRDSVNVVVTLTNLNEPPQSMGTPTAMHKENDTSVVYRFSAQDPERSGITYNLVTDAGDPSLPANAVTAADIADRRLFTLNQVYGTLSFKQPLDGRVRPNYEMPEDGDADNTYHVVVKAEVADDKNPRDVVVGKLTVTVTNVNEAPKFDETTLPLEIAENPNDSEKEPPLAADYLYLVNRGVGKPSVDLPEEPDLDVGIPVVAVDDDNTFTANDYTGEGYNRDGTGTGNTARPTQLIDNLTYELSGEGAGTVFDIVPATGQILTREKLDHEVKDTYNVTVKATDPWGLYDSIDLKIYVTDVDEADPGGHLTLTGDDSHTYAENNPNTTLGTYTVSGAATTVATTPVTWELEGDDASYFTLDCKARVEPGEPCQDTDRSRILKFKVDPNDPIYPNYERPRDEVISNTNTNTYTVTVKVSSGGEVNLVEVTVMVTDVEEDGTVKLSATGGKVGTPLTAELTDDDIVVGAIEWQWYRDDPEAGSSNPITGERSYSYTPKFADVGYHLTVKASYADRRGPGKSASGSITTPVADANAAPAFADATATREVAEKRPSGTPVGSPITATDPNGDTLTYEVSGADAASFAVDDGGQLQTSASFDYEAKSSYSVTITATDPESLSGSIAVTVNIINVDEPGWVTLSPSRPSVGARITADVEDPDGTPTEMKYRWSYSDSMSGPFTPYPAETTDRFTPVEADVGRYLRVVVEYNDVHGPQTESATTETAVISNDAPEFPSENATRSVAENTAAGTNIGDPVTATDPDTGDTLTYTLGGADGASFDIGVSTGQLMTRAALDYETKTEYTVTVTATDLYNASDSITVTIMVTDVDENNAPVFAAATATRTVAENSAAGTDVGVPVTATDADGDTLTYSLGGD